jgi:Family of unknown function (DUF5989)
MNKFEQATTNQKEQSTLSELWSFLRDNKRWWMIPIVVVLLIFGALVFLSGTAAAPFIYTLF